MDFFPLFFSIKVALISTAFTFLTGIFFACLVSRFKNGKGIFDALFTLPLVLPPTVTGFFLLVIFGRNSFLGHFLESAGIPFVFTWRGAVAAGSVVAFPLMYRTVRGAIESLDKNLLYAARSLGMSELSIYGKVLLPLCREGILSGCILSFARVLGEFGATMMVAGNIPTKTRSASIAIYTAMQAGNRALAFRWVMVIMAISLTFMLLLNLVSGRKR